MMRTRNAVTNGRCCLALFLFVLVIPFWVMDEAIAQENSGTMTGRILVKGGGPLPWGEVLLYDAAAGPPPAPKKYDRAPDIAHSLDADGNFRVVLPAGRYYLGAIKRMSGERFGAPQEGDYVFLSYDQKGKLREYVVQAAAEAKLGDIAGAVRLRAEDVARRAVTTGIKGIIVDGEGAPVSDAVVIAYLDPSLKGRPLFISERSRKDGKYLLRIAAGTYYLRVRNNMTSGPPEPGQIMGYYGEGEPQPVVVKEGEVRSDINFSVIMFGGRGPRSGMSP